MAQPHEEPSDGLTRLPLFPLNLVLFPGQDLPLHIFEERYKDMIRECLEQDAPFGVVLIKEGLEVGAPVEECGQLNLVMTEGRKRIVRRLMYAVGYPVVTLRRVRFGPVNLGNLSPGEWETLSSRDVAALRECAEQV